MINREVIVTTRKASDGNTYLFGVFDFFVEESDAVEAFLEQFREYGRKDFAHTVVEVGKKDTWKEQEKPL